MRLDQDFYYYYLYARVLRSNWQLLPYCLNRAHKPHPGEDEHNTVQFKDSSTISLHQACHHAQSFQEGPCECRSAGGLEKNNLEVYWKAYEGKIVKPRAPNQQLAKRPSPQDPSSRDGAHDDP